MGPLRAELAKLTTVRTTLVLSLVGWALVLLGALMTVLTAGADLGDPTAGSALFSGLQGGFTGAEAQVAEVLDQIGGAAVLVLVVGVLVMTTEVRHGTLGRTLQLTPSRTRVLTAKLAAGVVYALVFLLGSLVVTGAVLAFSLTGQDVVLRAGPLVWTSLWQAAVALTLTAVLGVAVGALLRSQVVAVTVALVWVFVVENLIAQLAPAVGQWLPFQAQQAIFVSDELREVIGDAVRLLDPALALTVFLGYVVVATVAAGVLLRTRDV